MRSYKDMRIYCLLIVLGVLHLARAQSNPGIACDTDFFCRGRDNNQLIPDPFDCTVYYRCSGRSLTRLTCPQNQEFDSQTGVCGRAGFVRCMSPCTTGRGVRGAYEGLNPTTAQPTRPPGIEQDDDPNPVGLVSVINPCTGALERENQCKNLPDEQKPVVFPDPDDCFKYYRCDGAGFVYHESCTGGQSFSLANQRCVNQPISGCFKCPATTSPSPIDPCLIPSELREACGRSTGTFTIPDVNACARYYLCENTAFTLKTCPTGQRYDTTLRDCVDSALATCHVCSNTPRPTSQDFTPTPRPPAFDPCSSRLVQECRGKTDTHNISDIHDCNKYYECASGKLSRKNCPGDTVFDANTFQCMEKNSAQCYSSGECPRTRLNPCAMGEEDEMFDEDTAEEECQQLGFYTIFSDPNDCGKYYECKDGQVSHINCPGNTQFDADTGECVSEDIARCQLCINPCSSDLTQACAEMSFDIDFPDVTDCGSYYRCRGGQLSQRSCRGSQVFDYASRRCLGSGAASCFTEQKCIGYTRPSTTQQTTTAEKETTKPTKTIPTRPTEPPTTTTAHPSTAAGESSIAPTTETDKKTTMKTDSPTTADTGVRSQTHPPTDKQDTTASGSTAVPGLSSPVAEVTSEQPGGSSAPLTVPGTDSVAPTSPTTSTSTSSPGASTTTTSPKPGVTTQPGAGTTTASQAKSTEGGPGGSSSPAGETSGSTGMVDLTTPIPVDPCYRRESCTPGTMVGDPENCAKYFLCESPGRGKVSLSWKRRQCPRGMMFDYLRNDCYGAADPMLQCQPPCEVDHQLTNQTTRTDHFLEGSPAVFQCLFFQPTPSTGTHKAPTVSWYLNGLRLRESSRIIMANSGADMNGYYNYTMTLSPVNYPDSGTVECVVNYRNKNESRESVEFSVLARPVVSLSNGTVVLRKGDAPIITCNARLPGSNGPYNPFKDGKIEFTWMKNGFPINKTDPDHLIISPTTSPKSQLMIMSTREDATYSCVSENKAGQSQSKSFDVLLLAEEELSCPAERVEGINWPEAPAGSVISRPCGRGKIGEIRRTCNRRGGSSRQDVVVSDQNEDSQEDQGIGNGWGEPNILACVDAAVAENLRKAKTIQEGVGTDNATHLAETMGDVKETTNTEDMMTPGNINATVEIMEIFGDIRNTTRDGTKIMIEELQAMVDTISNLLDEMHEDKWETIQEEDSLRVTSLMKIVDIYGDITASQTAPEEVININSKNLVMQIESMMKNATKDVAFPYTDRMSAEWKSRDTDQIMISKKTLDNLVDRVPGDVMALSSAYYKTLAEVFPEGGYEDIASRVLSLSIYDLQDTKNIYPPIEMEMILNEEYDEENENQTAVCGFWEYSPSYRGNWSTEGCETFLEGSMVRCECNHLTNFAILMTNTPPHGIHAKILSTITIVGLIISLVSLVLTVALYIAMWKHIKSHHAVVLINLCIALFMANVLFLAGIDKVEYEMACTIISALMHYFYLAAFFIMLVEGIQLMLYVVFVFHVRRKRETTVLLLCGWLLPAGVVGASIGITRLDGYGNDKFCWLDIESPLKWAFVGPVLLIILINIIILIIVLKRAAASNANSLRAKKKKVPTATLR